MILYGPKKTNTMFKYLILFQIFNLSYPAPVQDEGINHTTTEVVLTTPTTNTKEEEICLNYLIIKNDATTFKTIKESKKAWSWTNNNAARDLYLKLGRSACADPVYDYEFDKLSELKFYEIAYRGLSYVARNYCESQQTTRVINLEKNIFVLKIVDAPCLTDLLEESGFSKSHTEQELEESSSIKLEMNHSILFLGLILCITPVFFDMV